MPYFDYYATSQPRKEVLELLRMYSHGSITYANASSIHSSGQAAKSLLEEVRQYILERYFTDRYRLIFSSSATESNNLAIKSLLLAAGDDSLIAISPIEHKSLLYIKHNVKSERIISLDVDRAGTLDIEKIKNKLLDIIDRKVVLITGVVNNEIGTIQPINELFSLFRLKVKKVYTHLDVVHAFPYLDIDYVKLSPDTVSISSHKMGGIFGCGLLLHREDITIKPILFGGGQEFGKRAGTENLIAIHSMYETVKSIERSLSEEIEHIKYLTKKAWIILKKYSGQINGLPVGDKNRMFNNLNIFFPTVENELMLMMLNERGIEVSIGSACSTGSSQRSHVLDAISYNNDRSHNSIRVTLGHKNTVEDVHLLDKALADIFK